MRFAKWTYLSLFLAVVTQAITCAQPVESPLRTGQWTKLSVQHHGIYKIDFNQLSAAGFNVSNLDPRNISIYGTRAGRLPQSNNDERLNKLQELAIQIVGQDDGVFGQNDYILFYAEGPDQYFFDIQKDVFSYENHLYDDKNYYYLTISTQPGKRLTISENLSGAFPIVNTYNDFLFYELEKYNELKSGRQWFGEQFNQSTSLSLTFDRPGIKQNTPIKIVSGVMAQTFSPASFNVSLNGAEVMVQQMETILNTQYGVKGKQRADTITLNTNQVNISGATLEFRYQFNKATSGKSIGYLDFLLSSFERELALYNPFTLFTSVASLSQPISTFEISAINGDIRVWEITDASNVMDQLFQLSAGKATFSISTSDLKYFAVFNPANLESPQFEGPVSNQNLHAGLSTELLIVTHPDFKSEADRLASHRQSFNGINTLVVTTHEVFNDYSGGKQDPTAIRDFAKELYANGLKNILLFGRGSYDYKDRINNNTNFVVTYESRNSLSPLETYASDDYFGFLEPGEGEWKENPAENNTLDIGVGRLPVKTIEEATAFVDKLIFYDTNPESLGKWRKEILFVADDGDFNLHQSDADKLTKSIETNQFLFDTKKLYLDAYKQESKPSGQVSPDARKMLLKSLNNSPVIVNFTGHGSERVWLDERILDEQLIEEWENPTSFPLMVTATCEFGRNDDPGQISSSEFALVKKNGGAIGFVTATRPVNAATNAFLNEAFYNALFFKENGRYRDLGTIFKETKNNSLNGVSNRNFSLLADPSMHLAIPNHEVVATKISTVDGSDILKALSKVQIEGEVQLNGEQVSDYNGTVLVVLKDKEFSFKTLGDENPIFTYGDRSNTLFRGEASVVDGAFTIEFIIPKNIAYQVGNGKLSMYANSDDKSIDAAGGSIDFKIGESELDDGSDNTPPMIKLFMSDSTFVDGGVTGSSTLLLAKLSDQSGINIANYGVGNNLVAILDNDQTFELGEYYVAKLDDYTQGTIHFPMEDLAPGKHTLEVKAWDVYNNGSSSRINFVVTSDNQLIIEELKNYPNPFSDITTIQFSHNRSGEDLEAFVTIFDNAGRSVATMNYEIANSQYLVTLLDWNGTNTAGSKLGNGIYLLRLSVRSLLDGSKNEQISKLIILN